MSSYLRGFGPLNHKPYGEKLSSNGLTVHLLPYFSVILYATKNIPKKKTTKKITFNIFCFLHPTVHPIRSVIGHFRHCMDGQQSNTSLCVTHSS